MVWSMRSRGPSAIAESSTALIRIANRERPIGINPFQSLNGALAADDFVENFAAPRVAATGVRSSIPPSVTLR